MRSIFFSLIAIVLLGSLPAGCHKTEDLLYKEDPRIYFVKRATVNVDSVNYSFGLEDPSIVIDSVFLHLRIMGTAVSRDREINIRLSDTSTARPGYHFKLGPLIMPANAYDVKIPVYLYRQPGLKDSTVIADFIIGESKDFKPGYDDKPVSYLVTDRLHYKVSINDQVVKPAQWEGNLAAYFGAYSLVKFRFIVQVTGKTDWTALVYPNERSAIAQEVKLALSQYEEMNGPLLDETGAEVVFP